MGGGSIIFFQQGHNNRARVLDQSQRRTAPRRAAPPWSSFLGGQVDGTRASGGRERADATARASSSSSGAVGIKRV